MRKSVFLIAIIILFKPMFPVIEYMANYDYISKVLCVNKDKPVMKCNGKCHLMKELAKASEDEKPTSDKKHTSKEIETLYFENATLFYFPINATISSADNATAYNNCYDYLDSSSIFHPPSFIS